jgi:dipeptidase E
MRGVFAGAGSEGLQQKPIVDAIIHLTGKAAVAVNVLYIGTATYDLTGPRDNQTKLLKELGCSITDLVCKPNMPRAEIEEKVSAADVLLVSGGNTLYAMDMFAKVGLDTIIREAITASDKVLAGGSAGAICWFDAGHSDSGDPDSFKEAMLTEAANGQAKQDESTTLEKGQEAKEWTYLRVSCLGLLPGLVCPHADKIQSNGVLRMTDFEDMMLRHPGERGITIDHFAALVVDGDCFSVLSLEGKPGSVSDTDTFSPTREGKPGMWTKEVVNGKVKTALVPAKGSLASLLRKATDISEDSGVALVRTRNPAY